MKKQKVTTEESGMHKGANPTIFKNAFRLRNGMTKAEILLWDKLKGKQLGYKFRRQHPIGNYIADFYCHQNLLIIELDGGYHLEEKQQYFDARRTKDLELAGITVIRFLNEEVVNDIERVVEEIRASIGRAAPGA